MVKAIRQGDRNEESIMNIKWNANKYTSNFSFVHEYGNDVMKLMDEKDVNCIVDLGCGNGALSKALWDKGFKVIGIDASKELLEIAQENYPEIEFIHEKAESFRLGHPVDVVFSNAVLHWISEENQRDMLSCVYRALKKQGQFVVEFGGYGNNQLIHQALEDSFSEHGYKYKNSFYFPTVEQYTKLLEEAGFTVVSATLFDRFTELSGDEGLKDWIKMFLSTPFETIRNLEEKEIIIDEAVESLREKLYKDNKWHADYVRIRIKATKE